MQSPQAKLNQIRRILALWPPLATDDAEELLRGYLLAVEDYPPEDVELGVSALVKGTAPSVNPAFRPPPAVVGAECRRQMNLRLRARDLERLHRPALPPPLIEHTEEDRAKVAAKLAEFLGGTGKPEPEDEATIKRRSEQWAKTNARFLPDMSDEAMSERLGRKRGFEVGDPEDHEAAA